MTTVVVDAQSNSNASALDAAADFLTKNPIYELMDWAATEGRKVVLQLRRKGSSN